MYLSVLNILHCMYTSILKTKNLKTKCKKTGSLPSLINTLQRYHVFNRDTDTHKTHSNLNLKNHKNSAQAVLSAK